MSYQVAKLIARIAENLPEMSSDIMQGWIENPKALQKFLSGLCPPAADSVPESEFKVWKIIKLGTGLRTSYDFRNSLKENGFDIDDHANGILSKPVFTVADKETELNLVVVSPADLDFEKGATREQIYARAKDRGLDLCPTEVGPQLRLQYKDQPNGELLIAMEPIPSATGYFSLFKVERSASTLLLSCYSASPACVWGPNARFVFSSRKQLSGY